MTSVQAPAGPPEAPAALPDRRLRACLLDLLLVWSVCAAAAALAWWLLVSRGFQWQGWVVGALALGLVTGGHAVLAGVTGASPGKQVLDLRLVDSESGAPLGARRGLLRGAVLAAAALPTFGLGLMWLAWTAVTDPQGRRRGWHDRLVGSMVVDRRPATRPTAGVSEAPRSMVNLTAMRLAPPPPALPRPRRGAAPSGAGLRAGARTAQGAGLRESLAQWRLRFDTGEEVVIEGLVLVGRRPEPRPGEPVRHLVPVAPEDLSVSKTHAQLHLAGTTLVVVDRGSTNGSVLVRGGVPRDLTAGRPAALLDGDRMRFGDREMTVHREV
jgi:RDD family/FHA domain